MRQAHYFILAGTSAANGEVQAEYQPLESHFQTRVGSLLSNSAMIFCNSSGWVLPVNTNRFACGMICRRALADRSNN